MDEQEKESMQQLPLSPVERPVDGRGDVEVDRREESMHRIRVLTAVGDYLGRKRRRHGR